MPPVPSNCHGTRRANYMLNEENIITSAIAEPRTESLPLVGSSFDPSPYLKTDNTTSPYFRTDHGAVFDQDCLVFLRSIKDSVVDTVFADPPFNLKKEYGEKSNDDIPDHEYLSWCRDWINEAARTLKPGGAFFLYNLPKWNMFLGTYMAEAGLEFRHWIAVDIKSSLPIQKRLYPSHYSLLYFTKGKPKTFRKVRTPIELCRHCKGEITLSQFKWMTAKVSGLKAGKLALLSVAMMIPGINVVTGAGLVASLLFSAAHAVKAVTEAKRLP